MTVQYNVIIHFQFLLCYIHIRIRKVNQSSSVSPFERDHILSLIYYLNFKASSETRAVHTIRVRDFLFLE